MQRRILCMRRRARDPAESFRSERHDGREGALPRFATMSTGKGFRSARVSVYTRERERERDPSLLSCAGRTANTTVRCSVCTVGLYLSPWLRDFDFLCFTVRLRRRNAAAACNIVKPQESIGRGTRARGGGGRREIDPSRRHRAWKFRDRSILVVVVVYDLHARYPTIHVRSPRSFNDPLTFATEGSLPLSQGDSEILDSISVKITTLSN